MTFERFSTNFQTDFDTFADDGQDKYRSESDIIDELWPQIQCTGLVSYNNATKKPQSRTPVKYKYSFRIFPHRFHPSVLSQICQVMSRMWYISPMYDKRRRGQIHSKYYLNRIVKYSLANILGHGGDNQSPHIRKKFTRTDGTIIIRPLISVLIVASGGGKGHSGQGNVRGGRSRGRICGLRYTNDSLSQLIFQLK